MKKILAFLVLFILATPQLVSAVAIGQVIENVDLKINSSDGPLTKTRGYATFSWNAGSGLDYCTASGDAYWSGSKPTSGSESIWTGNEKTGVTTYQLTCGASSGKISSVVDSVTVTFNEGSLPLPTVTLTAAPTVVSAGQPVTLTLSTQNARSCSFLGGGINGPTQETKVVYPTTSATYFATCADSTGAVSREVVASVYVEVIQNTTPPGCTGNTNFSSTTGQKCPNTPTPLPTPPQAGCVDLTMSAGYGMRNTVVSQLQGFLNRTGYLAQSPTGYFGPATYLAVQKFQRANGISPIGYVGVATRAKIKALSCGSSVLPLPTPTPIPPQEQVTFTDAQLMSAAYSNPARYPAGFYHEETNGSFIVLSPLNSGSSRGCSQDLNEAHNLVLADIENFNLNHPEYGFKRKFLSESENDKFFDVKIQNERINSTYPERILPYRVMKCSYFESIKGSSVKEGAWRSLGYYRGAWSQNLVRDFAQFVWFLGNYNMSGTVPLGSVTAESSDGITATIYATSMVMGDWGLCDQIALVKHEYSVDKNSRQSSEREQKLKTINGKCNSGGIISR